METTVTTDQKHNMKARNYNSLKVVLKVKL